MKKAKTRAAALPTVDPKRTFDKKTHYTCPELKRNPGIDDTRFEAFKLPSRIGDKLIYPKRAP